MSEDYKNSEVSLKAEKPLETNNPTPQKRFLTLFLVVCLVAITATISALSHDPQPQKSAFAVANQISVSNTTGANSQAWYCPGPLPIGAWPKSVSSIYLADIGPENLNVTLLVSDTVSHKITRMDVTVPKAEGVVVPLTRSGTMSFAAVSAVTNGPGLAAVQIIDGQDGETTSNCMTSAGKVLGVSAGSTLDGKNINLAIYNPTSTPAVVNVALQIVNTHGQNQSLAPPKLQGITLEPGEAETFDVGQSVPQEPSVALLINALGSDVVAGVQLIDPGFANLGEGSLVSAVAPSANRWTFPPLPAGLHVLNTYSILNPNNRAVDLYLKLLGDKKPFTKVDLAQNSQTVLTPPLSSAPVFPGLIRTLPLKGFPVAKQEAERFLLGRQLPQMIPVAMVEHSHFPLIVERTITSVKPQSNETFSLNAMAVDIIHGYSRASAIATATRLGVNISSDQKVNAVSTIPTLPQGTATVNAFTAPARKWVLLAGRSNKLMGHLVTVFNESRRPTKVQFFRIPLFYMGSTHHPLSTFANKPIIAIDLKGRSGATIDPDYLIGEPGPIGMEITSQRKIVVAAIGYGRLPEEGISISTALPVR